MIFPDLSYPLPPDIQRLYEAGDFARMDRVIRLRLDDPRVPEALKARLRVQTELAYEILRAYPYTQAQMLEILQSHVKDFEEEELETLRDDGTLDWRYVNGEVRFKDNALSGLLKTRAGIRRTGDRSRSEKRREGKRPPAPRDHRQDESQRRRARAL